MKHIVIEEYGQYLKLEGERLIVLHKNSKLLEYPLSKIKTITVSKPGVTLSSNLILQCASRGIKIFFLDFRGVHLAAVIPQNGHAISNVRKSQFLFIDSENAPILAAKFIFGKIHNQRAVLKYFGKYLTQNGTDASRLEITEEYLKNIQNKLKNNDFTQQANWRNRIMGTEGEAAHLYWQALSHYHLIPDNFHFREGRHSNNISNQVLNFGYAILSSMVWHCLVNAGLEIYAGILHTFRPGKPSLVLDLMEEYRAWTVDRILIKHRLIFEKKSCLDSECKKLIIEEVHKTFAKKYPYHGKKLKLENILQRQVYRLSAQFQNTKKYRPYLFRW